MKQETIDWISRQRDEAIATVDGDDIVADYERATWRSIWNDLLPTTEAKPVLTMRADVHHMTAATTANLTLAVQRATSELVADIRKPREQSGRLNEFDRDISQLNVRTSGGVIVFSAPEAWNAPAEEMIYSGRTESVAEVALRSLVDLVPKGEEDRLDVLLGHRPRIRRAFAEVAAAIADDVKSDVKVELDASGVRDERVLYREQAETAKDLLRTESSSHENIAVEGLLDGMRTLRHEFYLAIESGTDVRGIIPDDLLGGVKELIGQRVSAKLVRHVFETPSTARRRFSYELKSIELARPDKGLFEL